MVPRTSAMTLLFPVILYFMFKSCLVSIDTTNLEFLCVLPDKRLGKADGFAYKF